MRRHSSLFTLPAPAKRLAVQTLAILALTGAVAPAASADGHSSRQIASQAGNVSPAAARKAIAAAERVEREMRRDGALESRVLGCWRAGSAVDCTGVVKGNDGWVKWRCVVQIRIQKRAATHRAKLTDAVCVAEEAAKNEKPAKTATRQTTRSR